MSVPFLVILDELNLIYIHTFKGVTMYRNVH